jgi:hypothetical protein
MASRQNITHSKYNPSTRVGTNPNTTDPDEINTLYVETDGNISPAQYKILMAHADEELRTMSDNPSAKKLVLRWLEMKGESLDDKIDDLLKAFEARWNPEKLSDRDIAELKKFGDTLNSVNFTKLSPKSQAKILKSHVKAVKTDSTLNDEAKYLLKKIAYRAAWVAAQGVALGPKVIAKTLQSYPAVKALGSCAVTLTAWAAQNALFTFLYSGAAIMGEIAVAQCNTTTTGGRRQRKTRQHRKIKTKRTRRRK